MLIKFSPQRSDHELTYEYQPDKVITTLNGETDTFDFSGMPDGEVGHKEDGTLDIETTLPILPILDARRVNGVLELTLFTFHGKDAPESERFPAPLEVFENE